MKQPKLTTRGKELITIEEGTLKHEELLQLIQGTWTNSHPRVASVGKGSQCSSSNYPYVNSVHLHSLGSLQHFLVCVPSDAVDERDRWTRSMEAVDGRGP